MFGAVRHPFGFVGVGIRLVEQAQQELGLQDAAHSPVHQRFGDGPVLYLGQQRGGIAGIQLEIDPGLQRLAGGFGLGSRHMVNSFQLADAIAIRDDEAPKAPLAAQHFLQQPGVDMHRDAIDLVIGGHHRPDSGFHHRRLEGLQVILAQFAFGEIGRGAVPPAFRLAMGGEMLGGRQHMLRDRSTAVLPPG